jgi:hypothetical protein
MPDHEIIDIFNAFEDEQWTNLELYCDINSEELHCIKYKNDSMDHIVTQTAKSAPDLSNLDLSILPTTKLRIET